MASPQLDDGYTRISNEILEAFARTPSLGSEAFQVLMLVLRRSYGFNRKDAVMSISFIAKGTGLGRRCASRAIERLVAKRLIVRSESSVVFNKNYDEWLVAKRPPPVQTATPPLSKRRTEVVAKRPPNKETVKETLVKETLPADKAAGGEQAQVNEIFKAFYDTINPQINFGRKPWRDAASKLIKRYGFEVILKLTQYACSIQGQDFAPTITNPFELHEKLPALQIFIKRQSQPKKGAIQTL